MKPTEISTLAEDLKFLFAKTDLLRLCRDHAKPFLVEGLPVLDMNRDAFLGVFSGNPGNRTFLTPEHVLRLTRFYEKEKKSDLPVELTLSLLLKNEWEKYVGAILAAIEGPEVNLNERLKDVSGLKKYKENWKPDYLFLKKALNNSTSETGIEFLYRELVKNLSFLTPAEEFLNKKENPLLTEAILLFRADPETAAMYHAKKAIWLDKLTCLEDLLYKIDEIKLSNRNWAMKYYEVFAALEQEISELVFKNETNRIILKLMGEKPHLSYEELYAEAQMYLNEAKHKHEEVLANIFKSSNFIKGIPDDQNQNEAMNDLVYQEYKKAYKLLRKKVYFLLHEDKIPGFDVLPPDIKRRITNLWRELQDFINKDDYRYEPGMLGYHCPDLQRLKNIYHRTCKLRNINPEDFDWDDSNRLAFLISRGTPIESLIELFEKEIKELVEIHLPKIELEKRESMLNKQTQLYKAALNDISEHENFLKIKIEELKSTIEILDNEISGHLKTQVV